MKLRDRTATPWVVQLTEIFEAAFYRKLDQAEFDLGIEILDLFERQAVIDPRMPGVSHPDLPHLWIYETPAAVRRLPRLVVVYTIDDDRGIVDLWSLHRL